jgi:hypothetical protein
MTVIETVTSSAGEQIDVVDVESPLTWAVGPLVKALWNEGAIASSSGEASRLWFQAARRRGYSANVVALNSYFSRGLGAFIHREINGKRCYEIRLVRVRKQWIELGLDDELTTVSHSAKKKAYPSDAVHKEISRQPTTCPTCTRTLTTGSLRQHLIEQHGYDSVDANATVGQIRDSLRAALELRAAAQSSSALPAVIDEVPEPTEPTTNGHEHDPRGTAVDLMMAMMGGVRPSLGRALQSWLTQTERVLVELGHDH